jgi:hypothetical protein
MCISAWRIMWTHRTALIETAMWICKGMVTMKRRKMKRRKMRRRRQWMRMRRRIRMRMMAKNL